MKRSNHIVAVSQTVKDDIISQFGTSKDKITVCLEGVSSVFCSDVTPMKLAKPYFLFVGSLRKGKNIDGLVTLFHRFLTQSKTPYDLVLVGGDFWPDENIEKTIKKFHLEDRVRRVGVVSDEDLARYYRGAVGFVTASVSEGFCLPAVEALASGCPVIAFDIGAIGEVVGNAGLLVPAGDSETFIRHMRTLSENPKKRNEVRASGKKVAKQYTWSGFAQKILHIIHATR